MGSERRAGLPVASDDIGVAILGRDASGLYAILDLSGLAPDPASTAETVAATAAAAVLTFAAAANVAHTVGLVSWSYDDTPVGGRLTITDAALTVFDLDITAQGPGFVPFSPPIRGTSGQALVITLASGGTAVTGKLNAQHWAQPLIGVDGFDFSSVANSMYLGLF